jgi:hypothetical protein
MSARVSGSTSYNGFNQPHDTAQPYLAMSICIAMEGAFPSKRLSLAIVVACYGHARVPGAPIDSTWGSYRRVIFISDSNGERDAECVHGGPTRTSCACGDPSPT